MIMNLSDPLEFASSFRDVGFAIIPDAVVDQLTMYNNDDFMTV